MSQPYPGIPGHPYYPFPVQGTVARPWAIPVNMIVCIFVITLIGWTPQEILRLLAVLHAAG